MSDPIRIGINGFGRIGREVVRQASLNPDVQVVHVNDPAFAKAESADDIAYFLQYDSVHGPRNDVATDGGHITIGDERFDYSSTFERTEVPWKERGADIVVDCTPAKTREELASYLETGVGHVVKSSPADVDATIVYGVNSEGLDASEAKIVSGASCTTNCVAPVLKVLEDQFGIQNVAFETIHAYTANQPTVDRMNFAKPTRGRAAAINIVPTTTGAAKAIPKVMPELEGKVIASAKRVPVADGSVVTVVAVLNKPATAEEVNQAFVDAAQGGLKDTLGVTDQPLVSSDILNRTEGSVVQLDQTKSMGNVVQITTWYDNESSYVGQMLRTVEHLGREAGYDKD